MPIQFFLNLFGHKCSLACDASLILRTCTCSCNSFHSLSCLPLLLHYSSCKSTSLRSKAAARTHCIACMLCLTLGLQQDSFCLHCEKPPASLTLHVFKSGSVALHHSEHEGGLACKATDQPLLLFNISMHVLCVPAFVEISAYQWNSSKSVQEQ